MRGTATTNGILLEIIGLRQVTEPVLARRRKKAASSARKQASGKPAPCAGSSAQRSEDSSESSAESSYSDGQQMCALEEDVRGSSGGSSCPSVDTDAESGLDDLIDEVGASDLDDAHEAQDEEGDEAGPGGPLHQRGPRHPSGTWVIWQNTWFYIAKTPPYQDVKCHVRHAFRTLDGLGLREMSKTLTPAHYGETWDELVRTILLLRSWAAWRVRQMVSGQALLAACERRSVMRNVCSLTFERPCMSREVWLFPFWGTKRPTVSSDSGCPTLFSVSRW